MYIRTWKWESIGILHKVRANAQLKSLSQVITSFLEIKLAKKYTKYIKKQANIKSRPGCAVES